MLLFLLFCVLESIFTLFEPDVCFHILVKPVRVTEWSPIGEKLLTRLTICFLGTCGIST